MTELEAAASSAEAAQEEAATEEAATEEEAAAAEEAEAEAAAAAVPTEVAVVSPEAFAAMVEDAVAAGDASVQVAEDDDVVRQVFRFSIFHFFFFEARIWSKGEARMIRTRKKPKKKNSPLFYFFVVFASKPHSKQTQQDAIIADVKEAADAEVGAAQAAVRLFSSFFL